jgi:putative membrane protein
MLNMCHASLLLLRYLEPVTQRTEVPTMMSAGDWIEAVAWTILGFVVLALVVWAVFRILPSPWPDRAGPDSGESSAEETLRQRFARGEIDAEEYERSLEVLRNDRVSEDGRVPEKSGAKEM